MAKITNDQINIMADLITSLQFEVKRAVSDNQIDPAYMDDKINKLQKEVAKVREQNNERV